MTPNQAIELIQDVLDGLHRSGLIESAVHADEETVLLGAGAELDSLELVTLVFELEERVTKSTGRDSMVVLTDVYDLNPDSALLAGALARYIASRTNGSV